MHVACGGGGLLQRCRRSWRTVARTVGTDSAITVLDFGQYNVIDEPNMDSA